MILLTGSAALLVVVALLFLLVFATEPWTKHPFGQSVMVLTVGILVLGCQSIITYTLGQDYAAREPLVVTGRLLVTVGIGQRLVVLLKLRHADRSS